jgi:hypothetical protein
MHSQRLVLPLNDVIWNSSNREGRVSEQRNWLFVAICFGVPFLTFLIGLAQLHVAKTPHYFVTNYMVSYTDGFVRRGLLGTCFLALSDFSRLSPDFWISAFRIVVGGAFLATMANLTFARREQLGWIGCLLILTNPMIMAPGWSTFGSIESLFLLLIPLHLYMTKRFEGSRYLLFWVPTIIYFGSLLAFCHEGFLFLALPVHMVLTAEKLGWKAWKRWLWIYLPVAVSCSLGFLYPGTRSQADAIRTIWQAHGMPIPFVSVITYFGYPTLLLLKYNLGLMSVQSLGLMVISWGISFAPILWLARHLSPLPKGSTKLLGYLVLINLPLFLFANDWARWISLPVASCALIGLFKNEYRLDSSLSKRHVTIGVSLIVGAMLVVPASMHDTLRTTTYGLLEAGFAALHKSLHL